MVASVRLLCFGQICQNKEWLSGTRALFGASCVCITLRRPARKRLPLVTWRAS
jgi:hypothetical protein